MSEVPLYCFLPAGAWSRNPETIGDRWRGWSGFGFWGLKFRVKALGLMVYGERTHLTAMNKRRLGV